MATKYDAKCIYCGKVNRVGSTGSSAPAPNSMAGQCPASPDGKHHPQWVPRDE